MEGLLESKPSVRFEVEKVIGISSDGSYQVQWAPAWVSKFHLVGCEHLIQEFLQQQQQQQQYEKDDENENENESPMQVAVSCVADDSIHYADRESQKISESESGGVQEAIQLSYNHTNNLADEVHVKIEDNDREIMEDEVTASIHDFEAPHHIDIHSISNTSLLDTTSATYTENYADESTVNSVTYELADNLVKFESTDVSDATSTPLDCFDISKTTGAQKSPNYDCPVCRKDCWSPSNLAIHMRTHTGEKPFQCSLCDRSFARKDTLKKHERTHSGEKPYPCSYCRMSFSRNDIMKEHMRIHTGDKRYVCTYCGKGFFKKVDLKKHSCSHAGKDLSLVGLVGKPS